MHTPFDRDAGRAEGEQRKLDAFANLEAHRESHVVSARRALLRALLANGTATADDVRDAVELPEGVDPVCLGSVPGPLVRAGIIERVGFATTSRPTAHARPISNWGLVDRAAAEQWLRDHPPPDDDRRVGAMPLFPLPCNPLNTASPAGATAGPDCGF